MDDNEIKTIVPRNVLARQGISAVTYLVGGVFLLIMAVGSKLPLLGIILSLVALVVGIAALLSKEQENKKPGLIITVAGLLGMALRFRIPLIQPIAGTLLGLGALGLIAAGIWKGIKFLLGLKSRQ